MDRVRKLQLLEYPQGDIIRKHSSCFHVILRLGTTCPVNIRLSILDRLSDYDRYCIALESGLSESCRFHVKGAVKIKGEFVLY